MAKQKSRSCYKSLRALFTRRRNKTKEDGDGERIHGCGSDTCDDHTLADNEPTKTIDPSVHYFNNAAQAPLSQAVQKLGVELIRADPWRPIDDNHSGPYSQAQIRNLFATLIDCEDDENEDNPGSRIAMVPSTAFAVTLAARNILACRRKQQNNFAIGGGGGRILLLQDQFDSAVYPWQQVCDESNGAVALEIVGHPDDEDTNDGDGGDGPSGWTKAVLDTLEGSADDEIIAACLPPLHWSNGTLLDLEAIGAVCRERNIPLIVDATQAAGIMPCTVRKIRPAMMCCSTHKWLRGPSGCCLVYISPEVQDDWIPLDCHGRGRDFEAGAATFDVSRNEMGPRGYPEKYFGDARKFDSGGKANPLLLPMLRRAMEDVVSIDTVEAQSQLKELMQPLLDWAVGNGYSVKTGSRAYHIIGLLPKEKTPEEMIEMAKKLASERGIILAVRCGGFRVSPYLDNTPNDVKKLIEALEDLS